MGTLFKQSARRYWEFDKVDLMNYIETLKEVAKKTELTIDQVIEVAKIKEQERTNNIYVANGDAHDEQMTGFGELFQEFNRCMDRLIEAVQTIAEKDE
jgi:hypothetical protein